MLSVVRTIGAALTGKAWTLSSPDPELAALFGGPPSRSTGIAVSAASALRVPAVLCSVRTVSEAVAQLPVKVYRRDATGAKDADAAHPAYPLVHDDANDWTSAFELRRQVTVDALTNDRGGFAFVNRVDGRPAEIIRLDPAAVTIDEPAGGPPVYVLQEGRGRRELEFRDVIHIRNPLVGGVPRCPVTLAAEAIGIALAQEGHAGRIFRDGGRPSGVLKAPGRLAKEVAARLKASWTAAHSGEGSGGTAVLEEGMDFLPLTFNSVDLQFQELRVFQVYEIARAFRVPPHLIFEMGRATWANSEEMGRVFLQYTLMPWLKQWEGAFRRTLFSEEERRTHFAEFLVDDFQRADLAGRASAYASLISSRVLNPNEARAMENRPPYEGGEIFANPNTTAEPPAEPTAAVPPPGDDEDDEE